MYDFDDPVWLPYRSPNNGLFSRLKWPSKTVTICRLATRVAAVLRRLGAPSVASGSMITAGALTIDRGAHRVLVEGQELDLTATEYKLLVTLAERRGRVQSRSQLLELVWEAHPDIQTRTVDMHVQRLRSKMGRAAALLETVRGFGYRFRTDAPGEPAR